VRNANFSAARLVYEGRALVGPGSPVADELGCAVVVKRKSSTAPGIGRTQAKIALRADGVPALQFAAREKSEDDLLRAGNRD